MKPILLLNHILASPLTPEKDVHPLEMSLQSSFLSKNSSTTVRASLPASASTPLIVGSLESYFIFLPTLFFNAPLTCILVLVLIFFLLYKLITCFCGERDSNQRNKDGVSLQSQGFSNPYANRCFANALLVCLYFLPGFKEHIKQAKRKNGSNHILKKVEELIEAMDNKSHPEFIERKKEEFFTEVMESNLEVRVFAF